MTMKEKTVTIEFVGTELIANDEMMGISDINDSFAIALPLFLANLSLVHSVTIVVSVYLSDIQQLLLISYFFVRTDHNQAVIINQTSKDYSCLQYHF